jgi:NAD(P)-dependent dehydrogenase (short-subunit alcohol dehydrogenase family)
MRKLENKIALITGASSGIGRAMAVKFAHEGATSIDVDINQSGVIEVVDSLVAEGFSAWGEVCDVGQAHEVKQLVAKVLAEFGTIDILVNNAGIMDDFMPAADVKFQQS